MGRIYSVWQSKNSLFLPATLKMHIPKIGFSFSNHSTYLPTLMVASLASTVNRANRFFNQNQILTRKCSNSNRSSSESNSIIRLVTAFQEKTDIRSEPHKLESELKKIDIRTLSLEEKESWYEYYGTCAVLQGDHSNAMDRFSEGLKHLLNSQKLRWLVGQEFINLNQPDNAFQEFDQCAFPNISKEYIMRMSNYAYLYNEYDRGLKYLSQFFPYYDETKILDDTHVYIKNLPFFSVTWKSYAGHCILSSKIDKLNALYEKTRAQCKYYDFDLMATEMQAYITQNYDPLLEKMINYLKKYDDVSLPLGYQRTQLACFNSLTLKDYEETIHLLDSVQYTKNDPHWLPDMILLAQACAANKHGMLEDESQYQTAFIERQPLLFEVNNAVSFGLLHYQERLKDIVPIKCQQKNNRSFQI